MLIRTPKNEDETQLRELFKQLTTDPLNFQIEAVINDENCHAFVAEEENSVIGFAALTTFLVPTKGRVGKIEDVVVHDFFRGQGLGDKLIDELIKTAKEKGIDQITLTSNPKRVAARNLYRKKGFVLLETGVFLLRLD